MDTIHTVAETSPDSTPSETERDEARRRLHKQRKLASDIATYVLVNAFLVGVWYFNDQGYFWPGWVMAGWGALLLLDIWNIRFRKPITESDIDHEVQRWR